MGYIAVSNAKGVLSDDELTTLHDAARLEWEAIREDVIVGNRGNPIPRRHVVVLVIDSRLQERLRDGGHSEIAEKLDSCNHRDKCTLVGLAFPLSQYGIK